MTSAQETTNQPQQRRRIECKDALGRARTLEVFLNDEGRLCLSVPVGGSAQLDWFDVDVLSAYVDVLRRQMPGTGAW
ncbi:hypothetical protein SAMN05660733_07683 [Lentzea albidocapillata]|uniref:Uncharacterized protein n=2 Tax=Lentzea albidocapillata TaxID=40571 RepID=A0A1W2FRH9_9PSEU|nr:hypothetical protein [Lentzea albidocapillata]SMD24226.1 hypothetical protein SAMN05660733_07683 [Lentzea albidocapillata]